MFVVSLSEVGKLELPKVLGKYKTGQLFLHRIFGYRGVILFPWLAQVYDRDLPNIGLPEAANASATKHTESNSTAQNSGLIKSAEQESRLVGTATANAEETNDEATVERPDVKGKTNTFYQVLIDSRDCPYIVSIIL